MDPPLFIKAGVFDKLPNRAELDTVYWDYIHPSTSPIPPLYKPIYTPI